MLLEKLLENITAPQTEWIGFALRINVNYLHLLKYSLSYSFPTRAIVDMMHQNRYTNHHRQNLEYILTIERTVDKSIERLEFSICFEAA